MTGQTKAFIGIGTSPWHHAHLKRVRFVADINGHEEVVVGRVKHVSPTGALMKVSVEYQNRNGKEATKMIEYPTAMIRPGSLRELNPGERP